MIIHMNHCFVMRHIHFAFVFVAFPCILLTTCQNQDRDLYKDPGAPVDLRVQSLLLQMTLEEKIAQMTQDVPENTRLGIPLMQHGECLHGIVINGATMYPQAIALGSTWDPDLIREIATSIAVEARQAGVSHCYSPVLDIIRDPRYGRVEECYGEDPYHASRMGVAFIRGLQGTGNERFDQNHILATAKHYAGYSEPRRGLNGACVDISRRTLYEIFLPPYEKAVKEARVGCVMPGHHEMFGVPCHMNEWLLIGLLRNEWGFDGFVVSDNNDLLRIHTMHHVAANKVEAAILGLRAGVDMDLVLSGDTTYRTYYKPLIMKAMEKDPGVKEYVDRSVARILEAKFRLGLFEDPVEQKDTVISSKESQQLALEAARKSAILLKNDNGLLPLDRNEIRSIAVIGPNAHAETGEEARALLGGYSSDPARFISLYDGIRAKAGQEIQVRYAEGCHVMDPDLSNIEQAVKAAIKSDVVVMALGGSRWTCGEGMDRDNLRLTGRQQELLERVAAAGKPVILVLINGRALAVSWAAENIPAILEAWYPGMMGGIAMADILFGDYNPGGKLTTSFPRSAGQIPVTYLEKPDFIGMGKGQYIQGTDKSPLFPFGYGLIYTTFSYGELVLEKNEITRDETTSVKVTVTNTGNMAGDEVVQLYVGDNYASAGRYIKKLKGFERIHLKPGESGEVIFDIGFEELKLLDRDLNQVVEPGDFTLYVGSSSRTQDLQSIKLTVLSQ